MQRMRLIGMLDSPYVRRVAISLDVLGVPFGHEAVSAFTNLEQFRRINPVVKAPTLVCDDGGILMDSALILQYLESTHFPDGSPLWNRDPALRLLQFRTVSYASAAADKTVQFVYERNLRPASAQHEPWLKRVHGQFTAAFAALETLTLATNHGPQQEENLSHASIWSAVVWSFAQSMIPAELPAAHYPQLTRLASQFEALPLFQRWPAVGPGVPAAD